MGDNPLRSKIAEISAFVPFSKSMMNGSLHKSAAVGQCGIMYWYDKFFGDYDKTVAQILLNADDIEHEEKKENLTNTFDALLEMDIIPIVNENDSVSYTEIESEDRLFGDNDMLSAVVAVLCGADVIITNGKRPEDIYKIIEGNNAGTLFEGRKNSLN